MKEPEAVTQGVSNQSLGIHLGDWVLLFVQFPGRKREAAGVLLLDPTNNELHLRLGELPSQDEEIKEIWELLPEDISQQSRQLGGEQVLRSFEDTWSNTFQIGERQKISIGEPERTLEELFQRHIKDSASKRAQIQITRAPKVTQQDLLIARKQLPRSSQIGGAVLKAIRSDRPTHKIAEIIEEDPILAAHLVRLGNSALYRHRGLEVRSVSEAIDRIGTNLVQRQVLGSSMGSLFSSMRLHAVWNHSVDVAAVSRQLSAFCKNSDPNELILVGLVHDIGRLVFANVGNSMQDVVTLQQSGVPLLEAEKMVYGVGHPEVGGDLLLDWNFPTDIVEAVQSHHEPQNSKSVLSAILHLAESWVEGEEDIWEIADHTYSLIAAKLSPHVLRSLKSVKDVELDSLRFAA